MVNRLKLGLFVGTAFATLAPLTANAAALERNTDVDCSLGDVMISATNATGAVNATGCSGSWEGNDKGQQNALVLDELETLSGLSNWLLNGSSDDGDAFTNNPGGTSGTLTFDELRSGPFAIALKASDNFSLYYFDSSNQNITALNFLTSGVAQNKQGKSQDLSHASLYTTTDAAATPTPALLPGLIGLGLSIARKRKQQ